MLTALEWSALESDTSSPVISIPDGKIADPVTDWDKTPPAAPKKLTVEKKSRGQYTLEWTASVDQDVRYYNLYFSSEEPPQPVQARRFVSPPKQATSHLDWSAPTSGSAYYAITAVDYQGNESAPAHAHVKGK